MRYGPEFDTLLENSALRWRDVLDVAQGVLTMRMKQVVLTSGCALTGGLVAGLLSLQMPDQYASSVVMRAQTNAGSGGAASVLVAPLIKSAFSGPSLAAIF